MSEPTFIGGIAGFVLLVAGVYWVAGLGWALIIAGLALLFDYYGDALVRIHRAALSSRTEGEP